VELRLVHTACMLVALGALIPFGVAWARLERQNTNQFQGKPVWFAYHRICQSIGCLLQLAGVACAVVFVEKGGHSHFSTLHTILGLVVVLLGALQRLNAVFRPHPHKDNSQTHFLNARTMWEYMHKGTGYLAVLFGILNVVCGILATKNRNYGHAIVPIMSTAMGLFGVCLLVYVVFSLSDTMCLPAVFLIKTRETRMAGRSRNHKLIHECLKRQPISTTMCTD